MTAEKYEYQPVPPGIGDSTAVNATLAAIAAAALYYVLTVADLVGLPSGWHVTYAVGAVFVSVMLLGVSRYPGVRFAVRALVALSAAAVAFRVIWSSTDWPILSAIASWGLSISMVALVVQLIAISRKWVARSRSMIDR